MNRLAKWDITDACNLRCKHCYNIVDKSNKFNKYHIDEIELQNFINNLKINNFTDLHLLGGEPLIINNLSEIISRLNSEGISVGITTNALLLNKILSKALLNSGISSIIISLDGFTKTDNDKIRGMGTFEKVIENIKQLIEINNVLKTNTKISISFTINGINYKNVDNIIDIIYHTKINSILLSFLDIEGNAEKNWNELGINKIKAIDSLEKLIDITKNIPNLYIEVVCKKQLKKYLKIKYNYDVNNWVETDVRCNGGDEEYYINSEGFIYPCRVILNHMNKFKFKEKINFLNYENDLEFNQEFIGFYNFTRNSKNYHNNKTCISCEFKNTCKPCPFSDETDSLECQIAKERIMKYKNIILLSKPIIKRLYINKYDQSQLKFLNFKNRTFTVIDDITKKLYESLDEKVLVKETIKNIYNGSNYNIDYTDFENDCLEVLIDLNHLSIIDFNRKYINQKKGG